MIDTPCIGICSTVYGDDVCRGCKRTYQEVIDWNRFSSDEKNTVYARITQQMCDVVAEHLSITDALLLQDKIAHFNLPLYAKENELLQAFHLLRIHASKIQSTKEYGIEINATFSHLPLTQLFNDMDKKLYAIATAEKTPI